jgi:hypothetical protein
MRLITILLEVTLVFIPLVMMIQNLYNKNSVRFQKLLTLILVPLSTLFFSSVIEADFPTVCFIGTLFWHFYMLSISQLEFAVFFYGLSINLNTSVLWFFPIFMVYLLIVVLRKTFASQG